MVFNGDVTTTLYTSVCVWLLIYLVGSAVVYLALPDPGIPESRTALTQDAAPVDWSAAPCMISLSR
ncbi:hypothetical protein [Corynebacterium variabile]|uniref:Uncharacterized protein n=1 Tax=Corynebacterium variabile TaxID=1727 RepID=A0A4Y4C0Z6_9CORY|nr:hypothetical protein [Corynebacterium variabile]GEC84733.1 hypothetical protein CVA01_00470 [Corynebacterium variabile]